MSPVPKGGTVAVTGAAGFIGGWVVRLLLDKGYRVRACVRDAQDASRTGFLVAMPGFASGRLTLHAANLDDAGCFDDIFKGCHGVCHLSHVSTYDDQDYVQKVCDHIINSVNLSGTVTNHSDCDDADPSVFPMATELADDGIDQDCDGEDLVTKDEP